MPPSPSSAARAVVALVLFAAVAVEASQYPGWGDTGWMHASKRECCNEAIAIAADYSANACMTAGGVPRPFAGSSQRGTCSAEWMQDDGGAMLYRCYGEAAVWCR
jgi:hypothetical protein